MNRKTDQIRTAWAAGDPIGALRIAARFFDQSADTKTFKRGPQPAPPPNWTGPQVGAFGGGSFGAPFSFAEPGAHLCPGSGLGPVPAGGSCFETPFQFSGQPWSGTVGVFAGYNAQFGNLVAGVEGDAAWKRISISQTLPVPLTAVGAVPDFGSITRLETL